jgi:MOSC domain-containing protein YiiM
MGILITRIISGKRMKKFRGKALKGRIVSVHSGNNEDLSKCSQESIAAEIGGFAGDKHKGPVRETWGGELHPAGTTRRNERQWSGVSEEELAHITERLELTEPLSPSTLGANLCIEGIPQFSLLPKGSLLLFASGAVLQVEEYNPPCSDMGAQIALKYSTHSSQRLTDKAWMRPASGRRGLVGVIDFPGEIRVGDEVEVRVYEEPVIRLL